MKTINWADGSCKISEYFTVKEACYLPSWKVMHSPSFCEQANILKMANIMDRVRVLFNKPVTVHCWIRPLVNCVGNDCHGKNYNSFVGGAANSWHKYGLAVDFSVVGTSCDDVRRALLPKLEEWGCRMEANEGQNWVHLDLGVVNSGGRYFRA